MSVLVARFVGARDADRVNRTRSPRPVGPARAKKEWGGKSDGKKPEWKKRDR